jgi:predicted Zn-dependent peptidase
MRPEFFKRKLANGITVVMEKRNLPVVSLCIANKFGGAHEKSEEKGVAHFIEHLLFTGTENRSHEDISREIEKKGGILNAFTAHEITSYWFKMPAEKLFSGMDILVDMLKNPKFDSEKFEKEKKVILEEIKMYHDDPRRHAMELLETAMYEKPFGELIIGSKETVSSLNRVQVKDIFEKVYNPSNFMVVVVGNADFEEVCNYLEKNFESGEGGSESKEIVKKNEEIIEERDNIDQAHLVFGFHGPLISDEGHTTLEVLDSYLASGMSSKLFLEIREKRGLAYAVKSSIDAEENYCMYQIYVGTTKEAFDEVKKLVFEGFDKIEEMTEKDLEESKEMLIGLREVGSEESINTMTSLLFSEMSVGAEEYYKNEEKIGKVTLGQVKELARKLKEKHSLAAVLPK